MVQYEHVSVNTSAQEKGKKGISFSWKRRKSEENEKKEDQNSVCLRLVSFFDGRRNVCVHTLLLTLVETLLEGKKRKSGDGISPTISKFYMSQGGNERVEKYIYCILHFHLIQSTKARKGRVRIFFCSLYFLYNTPFSRQKRKITKCLRNGP